MLHKMDTDFEYVRGVVEQEVKAVVDGDIDACLAILTDDALFMPSNEATKYGDELRQWLRDFLEQFAIEVLNYEDEEFVLAGDWAFHRYTIDWKVAPKAGGDTVLSQLKGIHILRRQSDGSWKLAREIWNANPPTVAGL